MTCEGTVHSIIFQNAENGYTVLRLLMEEGEVITVVGCIPGVAPGEHLAVSGVWETHPQHGEQLKALELERTLPEDEDEILSYLASGICKGHGPTDRGSLWCGYAGHSGTGAGTAKPHQGNHGEEGAGDCGKLPTAYRLAAVDGFFGSVSAAAGSCDAAAPAVW